MKVSRRSFLGGAVGSLALLFGGFGWREVEEWEGDDDAPMTATKVLEGQDRLGKQAMTISEHFAAEYRAGIEKLVEQQASALRSGLDRPSRQWFRMDPDAKVLITTEGIERDREILEGGLG